MLKKTFQEIEKMRTVGRLSASVLEMLKNHVVPGISTAELERICHRYIVDDLHAIPATLHHCGFPATICTSVNYVVCHGIPSDQQILKEGDVINVDVAVKKDGYVSDTSQMYTVGSVSSLAKDLLQVSQQCLYKAIEQVHPGARLGDIGHVIQQHAEAQGYSVVRQFGGHGIGRDIWEDPYIPQYGRPNTGLMLQTGVTFTIQPMINIGGSSVSILSDGWSVVTNDHSLSAQWEHTILVTEAGAEVLTLRQDEVVLSV